MRKARNNVHAPDKIDCLNIVADLMDDFSLIPKVRFSFGPDSFTCIGGLYKVGAEECSTPEYVSKTTVPWKAPKSFESAVYTVLWDLFWQADRGVLGAKPPTESAAVGWDGKRRTRG